MRAGSPGQLDCVVTEFVIPPTEVEWRFDGHQVERSKYSRLAQRVHKNLSEEFTRLNLRRLISRLKVEEGGNYSCQVEGVIDSIKVEVIRTKEEHQLPITNFGTIYYSKEKILMVILIITRWMAQ